MNALLLSIIAIVAGLAILLLSLVVVFELDLRAGGRAAGIGWAAAAFAGGNMALQAAIGKPPTWTAATLALAFAVLGWRYLALLQAEARGPAARRAEHGA